MIIYEVNITVNNDIFDEYLVWLNNHIEEMLLFPGFFKAVKKINDSSICKEIVIQYYIKSKENLNHYLENNSETMRGKVLDKFNYKFKISRKILNINDL